MTPATTHLMIATVARLLSGLRHVAVGASSPIPAAGALLAQARSKGSLLVSILGAEKHNPFTDGGRELFDCAAQGRIDAFFLSGVQIDRAANANLLGFGKPPLMDRRFLGNFGAPYLASLVRNLILFRTDHSPKTLVEKVDFITAPGSDGRWLLTNRCLMRRKAGRLVLESLHPGETFETVQDATGFTLDRPASLGLTEVPDAETRAAIEGPIADQVAEIYPRFAESLRKA